MGEQKIRSRVLENILDLLDDTIFTRHGFEILHSPNIDSDLKILLSDYREFCADIAYDSNRGPSQRWAIVTKPGRVRVTETEYCESMDGVMVKIESWAYRLADEIKSRTEANEIVKSFREHIDHALEDMVNPDSPFTDEEAKVWQEKLNDAYADLAAMQEQLDVTDEELETLREKVDELSEAIGQFPKRMWVRSAGNTFSKFLGRVSSHVIASVTEGTIKALLPPGT